MQIHSIIAAAIAVACIFPVWPAIAAGVANSSDVALNNDSGITTGGENFIFQAMAEDTDNVKSEEAPEAGSEEKAMTTTTQPVAGVRLRTGRSRIYRHQDARACLDASNNTSIIKCAEKYRYR